MVFYDVLEYGENMNKGLFKAKKKNWKNLPEKDQWVEGYYVPHIIEGENSSSFPFNGRS